MLKRLSFIAACACLVLLSCWQLAPALAASQPENLGPAINTAGEEMETTYTADGQTMYYACSPTGNMITDFLPLDSDICVSHQVDGQWTKGQIVPVISTSFFSEVEPLLSRDGNRLYFMSMDRPGGLLGIGSIGADIWVSQKINGQWSAPVPMPAPFNTPLFMDHCLSFAGPNEDTAYFSSDRPGSWGRSDIWVTHRVNGVWQPAQNLGPKVNSIYYDHHAMPSPDGRSLYFTSNRPGGYGAEDIWVTTMDSSGNWGTPVNLGPTINTSGTDACPSFTPDGTKFVYYSDRPGGYGHMDIWQIDYDAIAAIR